MVNSSAQSENRKLELMKINALFRNKTTSAVSILLRDSRFATPHIHTVSGMNTVPNVLPVSEKNVNLGRLSGLHMSKEFVWAFVATGDLIRWKKHESYSNAF